MMKLLKNKYLLSILTICILFIGLNALRTVKMHSDAVTFPTLGALIEKSNYVFVGEIDGEGTSWKDDGEVVWTNYPVKVHEVIKDDQNELKDGFTITQLGGEFGGLKWVSDDEMKHPEKNNKYVFFAMKSNDGHHYVYYQGQYLVDDNDVVSINDNKKQTKDFIKEIKDYMSDKNTKTEKLILK